MATATASRPSGPVLSIPSYGSAASPNRVKLAAGGGARSPGKSVSVSSPSAASRSRQSCMCSPTNHPGSFRCSRHKERKQEAPACNGHGHGHSKTASPPSPASLGSGVSTKRTGSALVRVGRAVETGTWARRALAPSSQSPHRRRAAAGGFRPRPSRLSAVSFAGDRAGDNRQ